jgi:hypothetical protein
MPRRDQRQTARRGGNRPGERVIAVYAGQTLLGSVRGSGGKYEALDAQRHRLGKFKTVKKAAHAISEWCSEPSADG